MQEIRDSAGQHSYDSGKLTARNILIFALALSVLWHVLLILPFKIVVGTVPVKAVSYPSISFVGAILENKTYMAGGSDDGNSRDAGLKKMMEISGFAGMPAGTSADSLASSVYGRLLPSSDADLLKEISGKNGVGGFTGDKKHPERPFDKVMVNFKTLPSDIGGPLRYREVVYKPELPKFLRWDESLGVDLAGLGESFEVGLKFAVSAEGKVESVERISSSGHPTIDIVAIRYLKGWQFAPLNSGEDRAKQWGTIRLNLKLEKASAK